jgi:hypothetical protein
MSQESRSVGVSHRKQFPTLQQGTNSKFPMQTGIKKTGIFVTFLAMKKVRDISLAFDLFSLETILYSKNNLHLMLLFCNEKSKQEILHSFPYICIVIRKI